MEEIVPRPLTKNQVGLLKTSFRLLDAQRLGQRFYKTLFTLHPQLEPMFTANLDEQIAKIVSVLELVIFSFEERQHDQFELQESVILPLRDLGKKHEHKGVMDAHYPIANDILLRSIQEEGHSVLTAEALDAWKQALDHLSYAMLNKDVSAYSPARTIKESFASLKRILKRS